MERERVEQVFALVGGELAGEPWLMPYAADVPYANRLLAEESYYAGGTFHFPYWYDGVPEFMDELDAGGPEYEYRTAVCDVMFGMPPARSVDGWEYVTHYTSSGETECPCVDHAADPDCALCSGDGWIYIGDGWAEIIYRRRNESD